MNVESIKKRIEELDSLILQTHANLNALQGAKQEMISWLKKISEENKEDNK